MNVKLILLESMYDGEIIDWKIANPSTFSLKGSITIAYREIPTEKFDFHLQPGEEKLIKEMPYTWLSEYPVATIDIGTVHHAITVKPQHWVKAKPLEQYHDLSGKIYDVPLASVEKKIEAPEIGSAKQKEEDVVKVTAAPKIEEKISFVNEFDLHAEALFPDGGTGWEHLILQAQMKKAKEYLSKAYNIGEDRVYLIHGLGQGKLKYAIHQWLKTDHRVKDFNNNYHPKYGFGATEVNLH